MGVPALFRWLSKKYPKIIYPVLEDEETLVEADPGAKIAIPINTALPNPNGEEFDCLYLDMNGIVHPCTHPEGKPAPETEEDMMKEVFLYTERVVSMVRPRKLLFMAIDGVAPRAKMNQQRSRRFRAAQEAKDKEEAHKENIVLWEAMGKIVSDEERNKAAPWDSNAITPGTPFMDLLAASLRYWVVEKLNTDPGWKNIQVIISDASVPGEGEHKIMDYIRRQRTNPGHNPNTRHVIYGLDADLIMLALATHEPYFRVLREDVFNDSTANACRTCGQEGHYAAQCTATAPISKPVLEKKPFIFLDVGILREYLEVELEIAGSLFPFDLEQAIDDWVLLIFFVGNDFLPHLPSLEIREGAIDTLLRIWKQELPRMGGYLSDHGTLNLQRAQIILEGLAKREDEIFRRRREGEERQAANASAKRRKIEADASGPSPALGLSSRGAPSDFRHPLPERPRNDFAAKADSIGLGAAPTAESIQNAPLAAMALSGTNRDVVANRRAIRMANMSAAEVLKAELSGASPVKSDNGPAKLEDAPVNMEDTPMKLEENASVEPDEVAIKVDDVEAKSEDVSSKLDATPAPFADSNDSDEIPGLGVRPPPSLSWNDSASTIGVKRPLEEEPTVDDAEAPPDSESSTALVLKVNPDGTVEQDDTVKLWEPGYRDRYYRQKFGVEPTDTEFRRAIVKSYVEGMAWVLKYYYQGAPSWKWYYPYHFAPFAADFVDVESLDITFELGEPFKPFEQLMGVFPAASRKHIPECFHHLMTDETSPIIDFYPETFQIDMNGKRMVWQGVALLPFIDAGRLLDTMNEFYDQLNDEEKRRNNGGTDVLFAAEDHPIYPFYEQLYGKKKITEPVPIDTSRSDGISGSVLPDPACLPGSTYECPLLTQGMPDIKNDRSLSVIYIFPKQLKPHRSVMLPGVKRPPRILSGADLEVTRNGGRGRGRGGGGFHNDRQRNDPFHANHGGRRGNDRSFNNQSHNNNGPPGRQQYPPRNYDRPPPPPARQNHGGYGDNGGYGGQRDAGGYGGHGDSGGYGGYSGGGRGGGPSGGGRGQNDYGGGRGHDRPQYQDRGHYDQQNGYSNYPPPPPPQYGGYGDAGGGGYGGYGGYGGGPPPPTQNNGRGGYANGGGAYPPGPAPSRGGYAPPYRGINNNRGGNSHGSYGQSGRGW